MTLEGRIAWAITAHNGADYQQVGEAKVDLAKGEIVARVCRELGVTEQTLYRCRQAYNAAGHAGGTHLHD